MEDGLIWFAKEVIQYAILHASWLVLATICAGGGVVLGALVFGRRYKQRIATLEDEVRGLRDRPSSSPVTIHIPGSEQRGAPFVQRATSPSVQELAPTPETWIPGDEADATIRQSSLVRVPVESLPVPQGQTVSDVLFASLAGKRTSRETAAGELTRNLMSDFERECPQGVRDGEYGKEVLEWWIDKKSAARYNG